MSDEEILKALAALVKTIRMRSGMTQEELAQRVGMSTISINRLETGKLDPQLTRLDSICKALGVSLIQLVNDLQKPEWKEYKKMSDGDKALIVMQNLGVSGLLPAHWKTVEDYFHSHYGYKPKDFNQILADLSHEVYCSNYPSIGRPVFKRVNRGTYDLA